MTPTKPGLIVHTLLPAPREPSTITLDPLTTAWAAARGLGMDTAVGTLPMDLQPAVAVDDRFAVLAARRRVVPGAIFEAIAFRMHDVAGVSVLLAPNDDTIGWDALEQLWTAAAPAAPAGVLGTVTVYIGLWPRRSSWWRDGRRLGPAGQAARLRAAVPGPGLPDWTEAWSRSGNGLLLWELPPEPGDRSRRRLLTMADPRDEAAMDRWTWLTDGRVLPPLTRYLVQTVKLRHQQRVLEEAMPRLRRATERTERACATLVDLVRTPDPQADRLLDASRALATIQAEQGGLITSAADAADLAETTRTLRHNMGAALGDGGSGQVGGPLDNDTAVADWLEQQLAVERSYLQAAQHRATELSRLATSVVDERQRSRQESLTLLQTSLIGSLLMALAAIQSFQYHVPLPPSLVGPLVCVLAATALLLPAVLSWPSGRRTVRVRRRYTAGAGLFGVSLGWLTATAAWRLSADAPAPPVWSMLAAAGGGISAAVIVVLLMRRRPQ